MCFVPKRKTFEEAAVAINNKFPNLTLIAFSGTKVDATFLDNEFGEFIGNYKSVFQGKKKHHERAKISWKLSAGKSSTKQKRKNTNMNKYGVGNPFQSESCKEKSKQTNLEKYGCIYASQSELIKDKINKTVVERFDVTHVSHSEVISDKKKVTCNNRYGTDYAISSLKVRDKIKQTLLNKFGVDNVFKSSLVRDKIKQTNLKKYGCEFTTQVPEIIAKAKNTAIANGHHHNIDGYSLKEYHRNSNLKVAYTTLQQHFIMYGDNALLNKHYERMHGKSYKANDWLDKIEVELGYAIQRVPEYKITNTRYHVDGYDPKTNTVYEFYGDFWHGNPKLFCGTDINPIMKVSYKDLYNRTVSRRAAIIKLGYNIVEQWES